MLYEVITVSRFAGVIASVRQRKTSAQVPVERVTNSNGLAVRSSFQPSQIRRASGSKAVMNTAGRKRSIGRIVSSEVLFQVHPGVERRHLLCVAVEHQCLSFRRKEDAAAAFANALFGGLAPAWMRNGRINVGVKAVRITSYNVCYTKLLRDAGEDLHQRRFAGTVFADDCVDGPGVRREIDATQGLDAAKAFLDAFGDDRLSCHAHP